MKKININIGFLSFFDRWCTSNGKIQLAYLSLHTFPSHLLLLPTTSHTHWMHTHDFIHFSMLEITFHNSLSGSHTHLTIQYSLPLLIPRTNTTAPLQRSLHLHTFNLLLHPNLKRKTNSKQPLIPFEIARETPRFTTETHNQKPPFLPMYNNFPAPRFLPW